MKQQLIFNGVVVAAACAFMLTCGCHEPRSGKGFTLPEGDSGRGKTAFVDLKCYGCHSVSGVELPAPGEDIKTIVSLGGQTHRIQTYGELVTSIINPSHKIAYGYEGEQTEGEEPKSKMVDSNQVMTVSQLIDLVKFLQSHYELEPYENTPYYPYVY